MFFHVDWLSVFLWQIVRLPEDYSWSLNNLRFQIPQTREKGGPNNYNNGEVVSSNKVIPTERFPAQTTACKILCVMFAWQCVLNLYS